MARISTRTGLVAIAAVVVVLLTACNPLVSQPTEVQSGSSLTSSWEVEYTGTGGWLEVDVTQAPSDAVAIRALIRDPAHWESWYPLCIYTTASHQAWADGASLGYQRIAFLGGDSQFYVHADDTGGPITFDVRVVGSDGVANGDLVHDVPAPGELPSVGWPIC